MKKHILVFFALALLTACSKKEEVKTYEMQTGIIGTSFPDSLKRGDIANLKVYFNYINGCGKFSRIEQHYIGDTITIATFASYRDGNCITMMQLDSAYLNYEARTRGTIYFTTKNADNTDGVRDTIVVY